MPDKFIEQHFETLLENLSEGIIFVNKSGAITRMNSEGLRLCGFKDQADMLDKITRSYVRAELHDMDGNIIPLENWPINRLGRGEKFQGVEIVHHYLQEERAPWVGKYSSSPIKDENGHLLFGVMTLVDITKDKEREKNLRENRDYFVNMLDNSPAMLWITEADGSCSYLSQQWYECTGQTPATGLGVGWLDATHPEDRDRTAQEFKDATEAHRPFSMDYRLRQTSGEYRWVIDAGNPRFDEQGNFLGFVGSVVDVHDKKVAEHSTLKSEELLSLAVQSSNIGFYEWDIQNNVVTFSEQMQKDWGVTKEHIGTLSDAISLIHPEDSVRVNEEIDRCVKTRTDYSLVYRVIRPLDKKVVWVEARGKIDFSSEGAPLRFVGTCINVTQRKEIDEALKKSEQELRDYAEAMPQMAFIADAKGEILYYNQRHFDYFGVDRGAHEGWGWRDSAQPTVHPEDMERTVQAWTHALSTGTIYEIEYRLPQHKGGYRWHLGRAVPSYDSHGNITKWYGTNTDIHDQKQLQEALLESEAKFKTIADAMPQMVWSTLPDGHHDYYNKQWYDYTGAPFGSTDGEGWNDMFHPEDQERSWDLWQHCLKTGENYQIEYRLKHNSGTYRWNLGRALPVRNSSGEIIRWMGTCTDIHDIKMTEEKLASAIRARDEFLSIASHELKTPLTSLKLQSQLHNRAIKKGDPTAYSKERVDDLLQQTEKQIHRLTRLVDDMLDVARIRSGKLRIEKEQLNFCDLVEDVLKRLETQFFNSNYEVPIFVRCEHTEGEWDKFRIEQVIQNLLTNAIRYGKSQKIEVKVQSTGTHVCLSVTDQGIGINPEDHEKIFDRFVRAIDANEISGLGLGLFITQQIVKAHNGTISVESEIGKGSTFKVELPRVSQPPKESEEAHAL